MPQAILNQSFVNALEPQKVETVYFDKNLPGFGIRVSPKGTKTYFVQKRVGLRERKQNIGRANVLKFAEAKKRALELFGTIASGRNPFVKEVASVSSFEQLFKRYIEDHAEKVKKPRSISEDRRLIDRHLMPRLRLISPETMTRQEVIDLRNDIAAGKFVNANAAKSKKKQRLRGGEVTANRCLALLSKTFNFGKDNGHLERPDNPVVRVPRYKEYRREEFLSSDELRRLKMAIRKARRTGTESVTALDAIKVLLLTGARCGEVTGMKWSEVDFDRSSILKEDSKTGAREIQYCDNVKAILVRRKSAAKSKAIYVFPGTKKADQVSLRKPWKRLARSAKLNEKYTLHTLRHTFASQAAMHGVEVHHLQKLLGHQNAQTTSVYIKIANSASREVVKDISNVLLQRTKR